MNLRAARLSSHEPVQRRSQPYKCLQVMLRTGDIFYRIPPHQLVISRRQCLLDTWV